MGTKEKKEAKCASCGAVGDKIGGYTPIGWMKEASKKLNEEYEMCVCDKCSIGHALLGLGVALKLHTTHEDLQETGACLTKAAVTYAGEVQKQGSKESLQDAPSSTDAIASDPEAMQAVVLLHEKGYSVSDIEEVYEIYEQNLYKMFHVGFAFVRNGEFLQVQRYDGNNIVCDIISEAGEFTKIFDIGEMAAIRESMQGKDKSNKENA